MPWNDPRFAGTWAALYPPTALGGANTPMGPGQDHDADFGTAMAKPEPTYLDMLAAEAAANPMAPGQIHPAPNVAIGHPELNSNTLL